MVLGETFTAIDIGSSKIKTVIGVFNEFKELRILGVGVTASNGVRKGNILDMDEFKKNLDTALSEAEKMTGEQVTSVYLVVSGPVVEMLTNTGIVAIPSQEITEDDINRALDMAQNGVDMTNRTVMKVIPETYTLDHQSGVKNPIGMAAKKLEVKAHIFLVGANVLNNIRKGVLDVGVDIGDVYPGVLTASEAVLTRRQKELGVVCIDIGASSTSIAVYEEGSLVFSSVIPVGGEHVTSDIALGGRIAIDLAEKLKIEYGDLAFSKREDLMDEEIDLSKMSRSETSVMSKKFLSQIARARYEEILYMVNTELKRVARDGMLPEGAVITGGGAKMRNLIEMAKDILRLPAVVGVPEESDAVSGTSIGDPIFAAVVGTLLLSKRYQAPKSGVSLRGFSPSSFFSSIKTLFQKLLP